MFWSPLIDDVQRLKYSKRGLTLSENSHNLRGTRANSFSKKMNMPIVKVFMYVPDEVNWLTTFPASADPCVEQLE